MEIIYKKLVYNQIITEQQAVQLGRYKKEFIENNKVKYIYIYMDSILKFITYYISDEEDENTIVENFTPLVELYVNIKSPRQPLSNFSIEEEREYDTNKELSNKNRYLYDSFNNLLCSEWIDINTNQVLFNRTTK